MTFTNFLLPCMIMGVGIAIDVTIATLSKFRDQSLSLKTWTVPITVTHVAFPATGYYLFWGLSELLPGLEFVLGITGFVLVGLFVYEVLCESAGKEPIWGISDFISRIFGLGDGVGSRRFIAVLAVSWDALWSGPAKAAQAAAGHWSTNEVFISFFIAGAVVAVIAQAALFGAFSLRRVKFANSLAMARFNYWAKLAELSVIGGFGVLALWQGLTGGGNLYLSIAMATIFLGVVFCWFRKELMGNGLEDAREAVA